MLDLHDLDKCITVLTRIKNDVSQHLGIIDKQDFEDVYRTILQEHDAVKEFEKRINGVRITKESLDVNRLLEDNIQLHRDNEKLSRTVTSLLRAVNFKFKEFEEANKFIKEQIGTLADYVKGL